MFLFSLVLIFFFFSLVLCLLFFSRALFVTLVLEFALFFVSVSIYLSSANYSSILFLMISAGILAVVLCYLCMCLRNYSSEMVFLWLV